MVILLTAAALAASTVLPLGLQDLSTRAHRVLTGKIDRLTSYQDTDGRIRSRLEISGAGSSFTFEMMGGQVGDIRQWIAGFPALQEGDRVALFLNEDPATPLGPTVGLWQGVFFIETDRSTGADTVLNHRRQPIQEIRGNELVLAPSAASRRLTLETFLSRVSSLRVPATPRR